MGADFAFVDTNVLVYAHDKASAFHEPSLQALRRLEATGVIPCISRQVVREFLAVMTRPPPTGSRSLTNVEAAETAAELLEAYRILEDGPHVTRCLLELLRLVPMAGRQLHDGNIVATMLAHGVRELLTFNTADFRRYGERIALLPT